MERNQGVLKDAMLSMLAVIFSDSSNFVCIVMIVFNCVFRFYNPRAPMLLNIN